MKLFNNNKLIVLFKKTIWKKYLPIFIKENFETILISNRIGAYYTMFITVFYITVVDIFILNFTTELLLFLKLTVIIFSFLYIYTTLLKNNFIFKFITEINTFYQVIILSLYFIILLNDKTNYSYYFHAFTVILIGLNIILWIPPRIVFPLNFTYIILYVILINFNLSKLDSIKHTALHDTLIAIIYSTIGIAANTLINLWRFIDFRDKSRFQKAMEKLKVNNLKIQKLSQIDELTGLYNRRMMLQQFNFALARSKRSKNKIGLLILDLDYFKIVNDKYGHVQGDLTLKILSKVIKKRIRSEDIASRIGGDEFCILFENVDKDGMLKLAKDLRASIANEKIKMVNHKKKSISVTSSIGCTVFFPTVNCNFDLIYHKIDEAMYQSKKEGRNRSTYID